jgi:hypothetical protein
MTLTHGLTRRITAVAFVATFVLATAACEDEVTGPGDELEEGELTLDASSNSSFTYMSFEDGGSALTVADPSASTDWHLAFRRFSAKLNGGVAGPGDVAGANLMNNASATDTEVAAFTEADADAAFDAVTEADIAGVSFEEDGIAEDTGGSWFSFSPGAGTLVANPGAAWKVRESGGGYALFRVSAMTLTPAMALDSVTIEYRHHDAGADLGALGSLDVEVEAGPAYVDLASGAVVTESGCNWDLVVTPAFEIDFNDACDAGTFPLDPLEDFTTLTAADDAPEYGGFLSVLSGAIPGTTGDASGVFWYNIEGNNRLWPTYNVFLVQVGTAVYKVQVTDYYNSTGASGYPTVRFEQLR